MCRIDRSSMRCGWLVYRHVTALKILIRGRGNSYQRIGSSYENSKRPRADEQALSCTWRLSGSKPVLESRGQGQRRSALSDLTLTLCWNLNSKDKPEYVLPCIPKAAACVGLLHVTSSCVHHHMDDFTVIAGKDGVTQGSGQSWERSSCEPAVVS